MFRNKIYTIIRGLVVTRVLPSYHTNVRSTWIQFKFSHPASIKIPLYPVYTSDFKWPLPLTGFHKNLVCISQLHNTNVSPIPSYPIKSPSTQVIIWCGVKVSFCHPVCCPKIHILKYRGLQFWILFCMGVKLGRSYWGKDTGWRCWRIRCWGRLTGNEVRGEDYLTRSFIICTPHWIQFTWSNKYEMGVPCSTHGGDKWCIQGFDGETWGKDTSLKT